MIETNREIVLNYLKDGNKLTTKEAVEKFEIRDLQGIIRDLRNKKIDIKDNWIKILNSCGRTIRYKEYYLDK